MTVGQENPDSVYVERTAEAVACPSNPGAADALMGIFGLKRRKERTMKAKKKAEPKDDPNGEWTVWMWDGESKWMRDFTYHNAGLYDSVQDRAMASASSTYRRAMPAGRAPKGGA